MFSWHGRKNSKNHRNMQSCVMICSISFEERGTHWCWKYTIIPNKVARIFPDTALDSFPYLDPARARRMGISSLSSEVTSVTAQSVSKLLLGHPSLVLSGWGIALPRKPPMYHCAAHRENPVRYLQAPFSSAGGGESKMKPQGNAGFTSGGKEGNSDPRPTNPTALLGQSMKGWITLHYQ